MTHRLRGRPHPPHHRRAAHPLGRAAAAAARQHGPPRRRHERRARPRQHPGQHRPRDLVGHPARLPADPRAGPEAPSTTTSRRARPRSCTPNSVNFFGDELPQVPGEPAQGLVRRRGHAGQRVRLRPPAQAGRPTRPGSPSSTRRCRARWRACMLSGMTATSIGPDSNQVLQALATSSGCASWTRSPPPARSSGSAPGIDPTQGADRGASCCRPRTGSRRTARSPTAAAGRSGRSRSCRPRARPATTTGSWPSSSSGCATLYQQQGGKFPDPVLQLTMPYQDPRQARARRDRPGDQRQGPDDRQAAGRRSPRSRTTAPRPRATGSTPATTRRAAT